MSGAWRIPLAGIAALALGAGAALLFADAPPLASSTPPSLPDWQVPASPRLDFAALDAQWEESPPWPAPPKPVVAEQAIVADEPPPPMPVGIAKGRRAAEAIFSVPGAGELRVPAGGRLPDGGRVLKVTRLAVEWIDGKGERHEHEMFNSHRIQEVAPASGAAVPAANQSGRRAR